MLGQDIGEGHEYTGGITNPTPDVINESDRTDSPLHNSDHESSETSEDLCIRLRLPLSMQDFQFRSVLGRGGFGKVLLAKYKNTDNMYALKVIRKGELETYPALNSLLSEKRIFQIVTKRRHPFLISLFGCFHTRDHACFAMEYAAGGDLGANLKNNQSPFPEPRAIFYSACVVLGLEFLHEQKIIHRDLKLENIVLDEKGFAKITDYGLCKKGIGYGGTTKSLCGTPDYSAPEILKYKPYTRAVDWWSLGVVIYVMLSGEYPFVGRDEEKLSATIIRGKFKYPKSLSRNAKSIIGQLLTKKLRARLGASEKGAQDVKEHHFFEHIDWAALLLQNVTPPFVPAIKGTEDVSNFSNMFTKEDPVLTPTEGRPAITSFEVVAFQDFNWRADWS
ncbi:serine/threonine-protein kinase N2-like [Pelobates fuscus]|uniref:serine/threonine-protein kinase N2-like n=1 Tax=Pelobates fuscus TaxID=191477 RepID=UPI002FE43EE5